MYCCLIVNETDYIANVRKQQRFERQPPNYMYRLPEPAHLKLARSRLEKEGKMWRTIEDSAVGMALLALVVAIAYGSTSCLTYCVNKSIRDTFVTARYSGELEFTEVLNIVGLSISQWLPCPLAIWAFGLDGKSC